MKNLNITVVIQAICHRLIISVVMNQTRQSLLMIFKANLVLRRNLYAHVSFVYHQIVPRNTFVDIMNSGENYKNLFRVSIDAYCIQSEM